jgi:hypothetical protein
MDVYRNVKGSLFFYSFLWVILGMGIVYCCNLLLIFFFIINIINFGRMQVEYTDREDNSNLKRVHLLILFLLFF